MLTMHTHGLGFPDMTLKPGENGIRAQVAAIAVNKIRPIPPFQFSTAELCALSGINSPQDTLHANRLRYVKRAISKAPAALWSLIHENNGVHSWIARFVDSCQWIDTHLPGGLPVQTVHPGQLLSFIAIDEKWYGRVRSAIKACLQFRRADAEGKLMDIESRKACLRSFKSASSHKPQGEFFVEVQPM